MIVVADVSPIDRGFRAVEGEILRKIKVWMVRDAEVL